VTRQLCSREHGHQFSFTLSVPRSVRPFPGYLTLRSRDSADINDWSVQAHAALAAFGRLPAGTPALMRAEF